MFKVFFPKYFFHCAGKQSYFFSNSTLTYNQKMLKGSIPTPRVEEFKDMLSVALLSCKNN